MKHHRIVIAALSVAIAYPAAGAQNGATPAPLPSPQPWSAPSSFVYPSHEFWTNPKTIEGFLGTYKYIETLEPQTTQEEQLVLKEVLAYMEAQQPEQAQQRLVAHLAAFPDASAVFPFYIGNNYFAQGKLEQSIPYYKQALEKADNFLRARKLLGIVYCQLGRFEEAIPQLVKTINLGITDGMTYGLLGVSYYNTGKLLAAESSYRNATVFDPDESDWQVHLATTLMAEGKYPEAIALLDQLITGEPTGADLWLYQANAYIALEETDKAAGNYEIVRRMGEATTESLLALGDIYMNQNLKTMALDVYLEAIAKGGEATISLQRLVRAAQILVGTNGLDEGTRLLTAIETNFEDTMTPDDELMVLKLRSQVAIAKGESEQAAELLQQVVDSDPFDGQALMLLAAHFRSNDEVAKAEIYYERAAKVPEFRVRALSGHADMLVRIGRYSDALPLLDSAYQMEPSDALQRYIQQVRAISQRTAAF